MSSSASSSDGLLGGAVGWSGGAGSVSALFDSSESGTSLGGVSSATGSPILLSGSSEAEPPVAEAVEQVAISDESGDVIGIDVSDEGDEADLPEISGYDWAPYEPQPVVNSKNKRRSPKGRSPKRMIPQPVVNSKNKRRGKHLGP